MGLLPKPGNRLTLLCLVVSKDEKGFYGRKDKKKLDGRTEAHPLPPPPPNTHTEEEACTGLKFISHELGTDT